MDWLINWFVDKFIGDPTGAIAVCLFIVMLFSIKYTRPFAIGATLIWMFSIAL